MIFVLYLPILHTSFLVLMSHTGKLNRTGKLKRAARQPVLIKSARSPVANPVSDRYPCLPLARIRD